MADFATTAGTASSANTANTATNFSGTLAGDVTGTQNATTVARLQGRNLASSAPTDGQVLKYNAATSQWRPDTDATSSGGGGISGVTAATGLTGGGTTGTVTVGIANNGVTNALLADGSVTTAKIADTNVTDAKISSVAGSKVTGAVATATNATTAINFTGPLAGEVTGTQAATTIANAAVTTSKIADSAITAPKISFGQVVKSLNSLKDDVTLAAGTNITITPSGNTLTIASTGSASGVTGSGTIGKLPLFAGTSALGDSLISQNGSEISMPSVVRFSPNGLHQMNIGTPNSGVGATFSTTAGSGSRADIRYDGALRLVNGPGPAAGPPSDLHGITIDRNGNVGVGALPTFSRLTVRNRESNTNLPVLAVEDPFNGIGISGISGNASGSLAGAPNIGVYGFSQTGNGVRGESSSGIAVRGSSSTGVAVRGDSSDSIGVYGSSENGDGMLGRSVNGYGVSAVSTNGYGIYAVSQNDFAGYFLGRVQIGNPTPGQSQLTVRSIPLLASVGTVCFNSPGDIVQCGASSLKWKTNVRPYRSGLDVIRYLRPISYNWKESGAYDLGLGAEDVAKISKELVFANSKGEVEGVKYEKINLLLINAVTELEKRLRASEVLLQRLTSQKSHRRHRPFRRK